MKKLRPLAVAAFLASSAIASTFAQPNLGSDCGCPPVASRDNVELSNYFTGTTTGGITLDHDLLLTCEHNYIMRTKLYVINNATLTIRPGTVIKGASHPSTADATALIIARGSKIMAEGYPTCPIVFTSLADNLDNTYPICARGDWGGLVILGKAKNNLIVGNSFCNGTKGVGFVEGYSSANTYNLYGMPEGQEDDNDNSGILKYVSIRHSGAKLVTANELNGISLGSVGRGTKIDYLDIIGSDDDGIEFFGGTVNVKHIAMYWGNDDMFDYDQGWKGNAQFLFGIQSPDIAAIPGGDNGFEADGDDNTKGDDAGYMSHPVIYNATIIGNGLASSSDFSGPSAIRAKERCEGEIYNSIFANFQFGLDLNNKRTALATPPGTTDAYTNWINGTLIVKNTTFVNMTGGLGHVTVTQATGPRAAGSASDLTKFTSDGNTYAATLANFDFAFAMTCGTPGTITHKFDAIPNNINGVAPLAGSGFFSPVSFRGAFKAGEKSWLSDWSIGAEIGVTAGIAPCANGVYDVNNNGAINSSDLGLVLGALGAVCQ